MRISPVRRAYPNKGHNTSDRYYVILMYGADVRLIVYIRKPLGVDRGRVYFGEPC